MGINQKSRPLVGVSSVVIRQEKILLGRRKGVHGAGYWSTPGGHLEYGETVDACAKRELFEETSLVAKSLNSGPYTNDLIQPEEKHYITLFVFITAFEGHPKCFEPDKCEGWDWFALNHLPDPLFTPLRTLIQEFGIEIFPRLS